jgi:hypothetical protein
MKRILAILALLASASAFAQTGVSPIKPVQTDPSGTTPCNLPWQYNSADGTAWYPANQSAGSCTWAALASGSSYNPAAVAITGGSINGTTIGNTTPSTGTFNAVSITGVVFDVANYANLNAAIAAANAYATTNETGSGHAINISLHDAIYSLIPDVASQAITATANAIAGITSYAGSFPSCTSAWNNQEHAVISGTSNAVNRGDFVIASCTTTQLNVYNPLGVAETHAATAVSPVLLRSGVSLIGVMPRLAAPAGATYTPDYGGTDAVENGGTWIHGDGVDPLFSFTSAVGNQIVGVGMSHWGGGYAIVAGGSNVQGLLRGRIDKVRLLGPASYTANVNGIKLINSQGANSEDAWVVNATTLLNITTQNNYTFNSGNEAWHNFYGLSYPLTAANGNNGQCAVYVSSTAAVSGTSALTNDITFESFQVNSFGGDNTAKQICIQGISGAPLNTIVFKSTDFEGSNADTLYIAYTAWSDFELNELANSDTANILLGLGDGPNNIHCSNGCVFDTLPSYNTETNLSGIARGWPPTMSGADPGIYGVFYNYGGNGYTADISQFMNYGYGGAANFDWLAPNQSYVVTQYGSDSVNNYNSFQCIWSDYGTGNQSSNWACGVYGQSTKAYTINGYGQFFINNPIFNNINTASNCSSGASPAVCGSASAGSAALPTNAVSSSIVVQTTAVTANSQIFVQTDDTLGTKLGVTCNSTVATLVGGLTISARTAGTSFTIANNVAIVTNPLCVSWNLVN